MILHCYSRSLKKILKITDNSKRESELLNLIKILDCKPTGLHTAKVQAFREQEAIARIREEIFKRYVKLVATLTLLAAIISIMASIL